MLSKINSCAVIGLSCERVEVEVDISGGFLGTIVVGLPDTAVQESRERVKSAIKNSQASYPPLKVTVNLAPADLKKEGPAYDLPIAVGILAASRQIEADLDDSLFVGELALDGQLRHTNGILPITLHAKEKGYRRIFVPQADQFEAGLVEGIEIIPLQSLGQLLAFLSGQEKIEPARTRELNAEENQPKYAIDMAYVQGQEHVKRALEIAASGAHNVLMSGPPGTGKTLLARAVPTILPPMTKDEALEVTKVYSVAGLLPSDQPLITTRPFRTPHHSASAPALVGGGAFPRPGEISLSHRGVLFLDELPEFPRTILENLRQPLEDGVVTISRAQGTLTFPASFTLIASMNPCPCGYLNDSERQCSCSPSQIIKYQKRISGPLLDRIDLCIEVPRVKFDKLAQTEPAESSAAIRERVSAARRVQQERFCRTAIVSNSEMSSQAVKEFCAVDQATSDLLRTAVREFNLSARSYYKILKVARTIADLEDAAIITSQHVAEALQYRPKSHVV